jgi:hypothetical protein
MIHAVPLPPAIGPEPCDAHDQDVPATTAVMIPARCTMYLCDDCAARLERDLAMLLLSPAYVLRTP